MIALGSDHAGFPLKQEMSIRITAAIQLKDSITQFLHRRLATQ